MVEHCVQIHLRCVGTLHAVVTVPLANAGSLEIARMWCVQHADAPLSGLQSEWVA